MIQELVKAGSSQTSEVIDTWLPDSQGEIINKLSSNSELQLRYLQDYLNEREADIKEKILASGKSKRSNTEVHEYKRLLKLHVQLLADKFSPQLKQVVMKEYYPLDCLDEADDSSIIVKEAKAYLWKRSGELQQSLSTFLLLLNHLSIENIEYELWAGKK